MGFYSDKLGSLTTDKSSAQQPKGASCPSGCGESSESAATDRYRSLPILL